MPHIHWRQISAIALGVLIAIYATECRRDNTRLGNRPGSSEFGRVYAQDGFEIPNGEPRSSLGYTVPVPVGTQSLPESYVLATGEVTATEYGGTPEYYEIGSVVLMIKPLSTADTVLRTARGKTYELVLREVRPRDLQRIQR